MKDTRTRGELVSALEVAEGRIEYYKETLDCVRQDKAKLEITLADEKHRGQILANVIASINGAVNIGYLTFNKDTTDPVNQNAPVNQKFSFSGGRWTEEK